MLKDQNDLRNTTSTTIGDFFNAAKLICVPPYQRAYSWEEKQCAQFLEDLKEQGDKKYYLGQILLEKGHAHLNIIDGQQRLTTTVLFMAAIAELLQSKDESIGDIQKVYLNNVFCTIKDDQLVFRRATQKFLYSPTDSMETTSQRLLINAIHYFKTALAEADVNELKALKETLHNASINTIEINDKIKAVQVFEYQNDRGKGLSRFEVIKAYLMHQVYLNAENKSVAENKIMDIQKSVSSIYRSVERSSDFFSENELLDSYSYLFYDNMRGQVDDVKIKLNGDNLSPSLKLDWITKYFEGFQEIAHSAVTLSSKIQKGDSEIIKLFMLGTRIDWKTVLLVLAYKSKLETSETNAIVKLLEVLSVKIKLGDYRSDYLPRYSKEYFKNDALVSLREKIFNAAKSGFKFYWNHEDRFDNIIKIRLDKERGYFKGVIKYTLWQYENELRRQRKTGALMDKKQYDDYTIEHIAPQAPKNVTYSEEFKSKQLHALGNLALLTKAQNSKFGNKDFDEKQKLFEDTALTSYAEIRESSQWRKDEIETRHQKIMHFISSYFDVNQIFA